MTELEYRIIERVGSGGSGDVYRAELIDGRSAAVKRLKAKHADDRLLYEARLLSGLDHRNIVEFYGIRTRKNNQVDLVMEWVGPSLERLLATGDVWLGVALYIVRELLEALDHVHGKGGQHRDVSPRNVLLGEDGRVKLIDFGLAKPQNVPRVTEGWCGSPPYISPEQMNGHPQDHRSDLFMVGVILYELLTGALPFADPNELKTSGPPTPVSTHRPAVPREFDAIVARFLGFDPEDRYSSTREAIEALSGGAPFESALGRADLVRLMRERGLIPKRIPTLARRRRVRLAAAAGLVAGLILGAGGWYLHDRDGSSATHATETKAVDRGADRSYPRSVMQHETMSARDLDSMVEHRSPETGRPEMAGPSAAPNEGARHPATEKGARSGPAPSGSHGVSAPVSGKSGTVPEIRQKQPEGPSLIVTEPPGAARFFDQERERTTPHSAASGDEP